MQADAQPLQERRLDGLAPRETPVGRTLVLRTCEEGGVHDGRNGQFDPVLPRACHAPGQAPDGAALCRPVRLCRTRWPDPIVFM